MGINLTTPTLNKGILMSCLLLFIIFISACQRKGYSLCFQSYRNYELQQDSNTNTSPIGTLYRQFKDSIEQNMLKSVINSDVPLSKAQPESTLGNLIADAVLTITSQNQKIDACIINYGSIGKDYFPPGVLTKQDFYDLIPNENKLVLISITGEVFKNICDSIAQFKGMPIAGFSIKIDKNNISHDVLINHQPVKENLIYTLVMNSLLLKNKSFYSLLSKATIKSTNYNLRSSIIQYFEHLHQEGKSIHPTINNRITYDE